MLHTDKTARMTQGQANAVPECPFCRSIDVEPIVRIANAPLRDAIETLPSLQTPARRGHAVRFLIKWTCVEVANVLRDRWACSFCRNSFR